MVKADQVPQEAADALMRAMVLRKGSNEALAAAINAWPGMSDIPAGEFDGEHYPRIIHLPLPTEASDE